MILGKRKCKICKVEFQKTSPLHSLCSVSCVIILLNKAKEKRDIRALSERKRETKEKLLALKTKSKWLAEAQVVVNRFIRLRDAGLPCISCNKQMLKKINAGHYKSVGAHPELRFNVLNIHAQCEACNTFLSGNIVNYRINLIKKIGIQNVEWLECKNEPLKLSINEIKDIIVKYKGLIKSLENCISLKGYKE